MKQREPRLASTAARRAFHCLTLLLLPTFLPRGTLAGSRLREPEGEPDRQEAESAPYLPFIGAPPLRFQEAPAPPDLTVHTAKIEQLKHASASDHSVAESAADASKPMQPKEITDEARDAHASREQVPQASQPVPILPDTLRPQVQAEDFLPYFVIPDSGRGQDEAARAPGAQRANDPARQPPSSATYNQTR